jgi:hypothetical protein
MTVLGTIGGGLVCSAGWFQIAQMQQHPFSQQDVIALWVQTIMYTILAVVSIFGFVGACIKHRSFISLYFTMLCAHFVFSIVSGTFSLYALFHNEGQEAVETCLNGANDEITKEYCGQGNDLMKGIVVATFVVIWLLELYGCIIVNNYMEQLEEEETMSYPPMVSKPHVGPIPITTYNSYGAGYAFTNPVYSARGGSNV